MALWHWLHQVTSWWLLLVLMNVVSSIVNSRRHGRYFQQVDVGDVGDVHSVDSDAVGILSPCLICLYRRRDVWPSQFMPPKNMVTSPTSSANKLRQITRTLTACFFCFSRPDAAMNGIDPPWRPPPQLIVTIRYVTSFASQWTKNDRKMTKYWRNCGQNFVPESPKIDQTLMKIWWKFMEFSSKFGYVTSFAYVATWVNFKFWWIW